MQSMHLRGEPRDRVLVKDLSGKDLDTLPQRSSQSDQKPLVRAQLVQHPRILPANALHRVSGAVLLGQHVEGVGFDLQV